MLLIFRSSALASISLSWNSGPRLASLASLVFEAVGFLEFTNALCEFAKTRIQVGNPVAMTWLVFPTGVGSIQSHSHIQQRGLHPAMIKAGLIKDGNKASVLGYMRSATSTLRGASIGRSTVVSNCRRGPG